MSQDNHPLLLNIQGSSEELKIRSLDGEEEIGQLYHYQLEVQGHKHNVDGLSLLGKAASVTMKLMDDSNDKRQFNGIICTFEQMNLLPEGDLGYPFRYRLTLRPRLWQLTLGRHCRFFYNKSVPEILDQILIDYGLNADEKHYSQSYPKLEHCVQYNETDYAFLCRLLEREGIYYFFRHEGGKDQLILCDALAAHPSVPQTGMLNYAKGDQYERLDFWQRQWALHTKAVKLNAYDFTNPPNSLNQGLRAPASLNTKQGVGESQHDHDVYTNYSEGQRYAQIQLEAAQASASRTKAQSTTFRIAPGYCFTLQAHPNDDFNTDYLIVAAHYQVDNFPYSSSSRVLRTPECTFEVQPKKLPFRLPQITPPPQPAGPQTALVIGPGEGEEIHIDKYGRIQVQFNWEQFAPPSQDKRTQRCWVRVAHNWAGKGWGALFLPRAGQEVIVDFINGNIDKPIVTGCVYNDTNMQPYPLPKHGAVSTLRTHSTTGSGYNELRFIDTSGKEQVFVHAEKDWKNYVKKDALAWIGGNQHHRVEGEQRLLVGKDLHTQVKGALKQQVSNQISLHGAQTMVLQAGTDISMKGLSISLNGTTGIALESNISISLKVGGSFVALTPAGVNINGPMVQLNTPGAQAPSGKNLSTQTPQSPSITQSDDGSQEVS